MGSTKWSEEWEWATKSCLGLKIWFLERVIMGWWLIIGKGEEGEEGKLFAGEQVEARLSLNVSAL